MNDYEVGYGKPPKGKQFKPGFSGNKKGRPKGSKNTMTLLNEELNKKIVLKEGGHSIKLSKRESIIKQVIHKAIKGDIKALQLSLKMMFEVDSHNETLQKVKAKLSQEDDKILSSFLEWNGENDGS